MKVYILTKKDKIVAISESKNSICGFCLQNNLKDSLYKILVCKNEKTCNKLLVNYQDVYIIPYHKYFIRECDFREIDNTIQSMICNIETTRKTLKDIESMIDIESMEEIELYRKCYKKLKNYKKRIPIRDVIYSYYAVNDLHYDTFVNDI